MLNRLQFERWGRTAAFGFLLGALGACDNLLEVSLPHLLTDAALAGPETAETQVNSAIALFECGSSTFSYIALGHEDVLQSVAGIGGGNAIYRATPDEGGTCDNDSASGNWFDQFMGARAAISRDPTMVPGSLGDNRGVYDRINNDPEWAGLGTDGVRLSAIASIYMAATMAHFGEFYCEFTLDGGELQTPADGLRIAIDWLDVALGHIGGTDFAMPFGVASSATTMVAALRARILYASGDLAGAAAAAATVPDGFTAWITRESGEQRRNKIFHAAQEVKFGAMYGKVDFWTPSIRGDKPGGGKWQDPVQFTGYIFLGIQADGRAVDAAGNAITWAEEIRDLTVAPEVPIPLAGFTSADADTRVPTAFQSVQGPGKFEVPTKYSSEGDDIPMISWQELRLIRAEAAATAAEAIGHIDAIRAAAGLPLVTYGPSTATEITYMIHEEHRRELFAGGARYWSYKIQNPTRSWFPRQEGVTPFQGYNLGGGVRLLFPNSEYENNANWAAAGGLTLRGTGCSADQRPSFQ